jgi:uncharacterized protein
MQIDVSQLLKAPIGESRDHEVTGHINIAGADSVVRGAVRLTRTDRGILVKATLYTGVEASCSRCLSLFSCPLVLNIEEEYYPTTNIATGAKLLLPEEPGSFTIGEDFVLDLTEAVRQYALLVMPMKPLCRRDCCGLCPHCGHNLNEGPCDCPIEEIDPRWEKLLKLTLSHDGEANR